MGQIRKRGAFYQIRYYRNGHRIEESTRLTKYDDARDELKKTGGRHRGWRPSHVADWPRHV